MRKVTIIYQAKRLDNCNSILCNYNYCVSQRTNIWLKNKHDVARILPFAKKQNII